jgi:hypothetical protein
VVYLERGSLCGQVPLRMKDFCTAPGSAALEIPQLSVPVPLVRSPIPGQPVSSDLII